MPAKVTKNPVNNYKGWLQLGETSCCNFSGRCWGEVCGRRTDTIKHPPWRRGNAFWIKDLVILHQHHILCAPFACSLPQPHPGQHWTNSGAVKAKLLQSAFFFKKNQGFWIWHILNLGIRQRQVLFSGLQDEVEHLLHSLLSYKCFKHCLSSL